MIAELGIGALVFVAGVCLISGFAHGALGFGFPIVATPLVALVIDIKSAIALLAPLTLVLVVISVVRGGRLGALLREYWFMPFAMALGAWLGTRLLLAAPPEPFILLLAAVILLYLNIDRLGRGTSPLVQSLRVPFGVAFGLVAGTLEALANVAGPILQWMKNPSARRALRTELLALRQKFGGNGASERAARAILEKVA